jgi:hypothetical protein
MHVFPVIVIRSACAGVHHNYRDAPGQTYTCAGVVSDRLLFSFAKKARRDVQLTLPPPPKHCPQGTTAERPPSAGLGRLMCTRTVREPGARCERKRAGRKWAGSLYVGGPASSMRMRRFGSAAARRPARTQPAAPPNGVFSVKRRWSRRGAGGRRTACDDDIVVFVDSGWCGHRTLPLANLTR